jgi:hypothetical protein
MEKDPRQYIKLAMLPEYKPVVGAIKVKLAAKMEEVRAKDLSRQK